MAEPKHPWLFTMWWGELEEYQLVALEAVDWTKALYDLPGAAGLKKVPAEYEVISAVAVKPEGLDTEAVNIYFEAGENPKYADHIDEADQAAAGLWRKKTPKGPLNQYVITGTVTDDDLRFAQDLNDPSLDDAIATVTAYYKGLDPGTDPSLRFYSAVELTHDGTVNAYWLLEPPRVLRYTFPAIRGQVVSEKKLKEALAGINRHRRKVGQRPLDPAAAGWKPEDVLAEARRLGKTRNPSDVIKARMLDWKWP